MAGVRRSRVHAFAGVLCAGVAFCTIFSLVPPQAMAQIAAPGGVSVAEDPVAEELTLNKEGARTPLSFHAKLRGSPSASAWQTSSVWSWAIS